MLVAASLGACEAELDESCTDADGCSGATVGSGTPLPAECGGLDTGGLPCDVFQVLSSSCHGCHTSPPANGAPFPLLTFADTQIDYGALKVWQVMTSVVEPGGGGRVPMPLNANPMAEENIATLRAWFATCNPGPCASVAVQGQGGAGGQGGGSTGSSGGEGGEGGEGGGGNGGSSGGATAR